MQNAVSDSLLVVFSIKVYRLFLNVYPKKYREEYGLQMAQLFRDCCLRAIRHDGTFGLFVLWVVTLLDLIRSSIAEHLHKEVGMTAPNYYRLCGWALVLGAAVFLPWQIFAPFINTHYISMMNRWFSIIGVIGFICGPVLMAVGMMGLRARYGKEVGSLGKTILVVGVIAGALSPILTILPETIYDISIYVVFAMFFGAVILQMVCMTIFGVLTSKYKPFPYGNQLPMAAGLYLPTYILMIPDLITKSSVIENPILIVLEVACSILATVGLIRLGLILHADRQKDFVPLAV